MTSNYALRLWASWKYHAWDVNDPKRQHTLTYAAAVDLLMRNLSWREKRAVRGKYLCELLHWKQSALVSALRKIEQGLVKRKLTNKSVYANMSLNVNKEVTGGQEGN